MGPAIVDLQKVLRPQRVQGPQKVQCVVFQYVKVQHTILYFHKWTMSSAFFSFLFENQKNDFEVKYSYFSTISHPQIFILFLLEIYIICFVSSMSHIRLAPVEYSSGNIQNIRNIQNS